MTILRLRTSEVGATFDLNINSLIYAHHEKEFFTCYTNYQKYCSDPFKRHVQLISKSLTPISWETYQKYSFLPIVPGKKLCVSCFKEVRKSMPNNDSPAEEEHPCEFQESIETEIGKESAQSVLSNLRKIY